MPRAVKGQRFGGRKKGTPNRRTVLARTVAEGLQRAGVDPVEVLAGALAGKVKSDLRVKAAHILMPYLHAQKATELRLGGVAGAPIEQGPIQIRIDYGDSGTEIHDSLTSAAPGADEGDS